MVLDCCKRQKRIIGRAYPILEEEQFLEQQQSTGRLQKSPARHCPKNATYPRKIPFNATALKKAYSMRAKNDFLMPAELPRYLFARYIKKGRNQPATVLVREIIKMIRKQSSEEVAS